MNETVHKHFAVETPAMIFDRAEIQRCAKRVRAAVTSSGAQLLYALKACHVVPVLEEIVQSVDGMSTSSAWEAMLAREFCGPGKSVHYTSPGLRESDIDQAAPLYDYVSCNSLGQWRRVRSLLPDQTEVGIRINPELSFAQDPRYDPCCSNSKLGISGAEFAALFDDGPAEFTQLRGLLFHNNCDSNDFAELLATVRNLERNLDRVLRTVHWVNIGGGYLFGKLDRIDAFAEAVDILTRKYDLTVFVEPGAAIVRSSGFLVSTVVDTFDSGGKSVAILDTTVNHLPEVFEYQYEPDVREHVDGAPYEYTLAGCSCLAGDIFGDYSFDEPLSVGSRIIFENVGAYSLVKAHMFNGINLPSIHMLDEVGVLKLVKEFTFEDFANRCGLSSNEYANL